MADHFECMLDWDLDAVIRGCCSDNNNNGGGYGYGYPSSMATYYESIQQADDLLLSSDFPDYSSVNLDDLEEIYKPFYSLMHQYPAAAASSPQPSTITTILPAPCVASASRDVKEESLQKLEKQDSLSGSDLTTTSISATAAASTRPKRKSQQKRMVQHVTADGLSADKWAWRKYGQKPIKGSPYPRSYYRCSSSKGCPARKQVEQNSSDPNMFIIAYRAEHNHAQPTRRSSLSGITRNKLSSNKQPATARTSSTTSTPQSSSSSPVSPPTNLSPATPMMSGVTDDEFHVHRSCRVVEDEEITKLSEEDEFMFQEDFFKGLEEFDGMAFDGSLLDQVVTGFPHWIDERSSASAASYNNMAYM